MFFTSVLFFVFCKNVSNLGVDWGDVGSVTHKLWLSAGEAPAQQGADSSTRMATGRTLGPEHTAQIDFTASSDWMRRELGNKLKTTDLRQPLCVLSVIKSVFCGPGEKQLMSQKDRAFSPRPSTGCGLDSHSTPDLRSL